MGDDLLRIDCQIDGCHSGETEDEDQAPKKVERLAREHI
jgi:hypothetical protein